MALSLLRARLSVQGRSYATGIAKTIITGNNATKVVRNSGNNNNLRRHFSAGAESNSSEAAGIAKPTTKARRGYKGPALLGFAGGFGLHYGSSLLVDRKLSEHLESADHKCLSDQAKAEMQRYVDSKFYPVQARVNDDVFQSIQRVDNAISRSRSENPDYLQLKAEIREEQLTIRRSYREMEEKNKRTLAQLRAADEAKLAALQREIAEIRKDIGKLQTRS